MKIPWRAANEAIRKKLVRRLLEEQDKVLRSYFAQKGGTRSKGEDRSNCKGPEHVQGACMREDGARGSWPSDQLSLQWGAWKSGFLFVYYFLWFS